MCIGECALAEYIDFQFFLELAFVIDGLIDIIVGTLYGGGTTFNASICL